MSETTIVGKAGDIKQKIRLLSLPYQGDVLYNPLKLDIREDGIFCAVQSQRKTSFLQAKTDLGKIDGTGDVVVDSEELLKFLDVYRPEENVRIHVGDTIRIEGDRKTSTVYGQALDPLVPATLPEFDDGIVQFKVGEDEYLPATARTEIDAGNLAGLIDDAKTVDVASFELDFDPHQAQAKLGSLRAKHNEIDVLLDCHVEGDGARTVIGDDFVHLFSNLIGDVEVQFGDNMPLVAIYENDDRDRFVYALSPRKED